MGGKASGGPNPQYAQAAYQNAYSAAQRGAGWEGALSQQFSGKNQPYADYGYAGWQAGRPAPPMAMPEFGFEFPEMPAAQNTGPSYEQRMADQQAQYDAQLAEQKRIAGLNQRDELYGAYMDAAGAATDYVNSEIDREMANARLLGIDYELTDELKNTRISDYFATVWGEGQQGQLEGLIKQWGKPTGFTDFTIKRGDGSKYAGKPGSETVASTSEGMKPKGGTILTDEDEEVLGAESILGV